MLKEILDYINQILKAILMLLSIIVIIGLLNNQGQIDIFNHGGLDVNLWNDLTIDGELDINK